MFDNKSLAFNECEVLGFVTVDGETHMSEFIPTIETVGLEAEEYSLEKDMKEILRQPLVDILVALMLINDLFLFLRHEL